MGYLNEVEETRVEKDCQRFNNKRSNPIRVGLFYA